MSNNTVVVFAGGMLVAGVLVAGGMSRMTSSAAPASFSDACRGSLGEVASLMGKQAEEVGQTAGLLQKVAVSQMISSVCDCTHEALKDDIAADKLPIAGKLTGLRFKSMMKVSLRTDDGSVSARDAARDDVEKLMSDNNLSLDEIDGMAKVVDAAVNQCSRKHNRRI